MRAKPDVCAPIDANGNLTSDGTKSYYWNALNQLVEVKEGTTTIATFEHDGEGRRTEKAAGGLTHQYIYDVDDIVEERISGSSSDTIRYYHGTGIDEPLARKNSSDVVTYYLADHLGSIVQETSSSGGVAFEREYDAWGEQVQGATTSGYSFTGREWDSEVGLYYNRNRYYNAGIARFIGEDPIGLAGGTNVHSYVLNGPVRANDPFGLDLYIVGSHSYAATFNVGGAVVVSVSVAEQFVVNPRTGEVTMFTSGAVGGGFGVGLRYSANNEVGFADLESPDDISGLGLFFNMASAAGPHGASVTYSGNGKGSSGISGGHSVGAGGSITAGPSYAGLKKKGSLADLPDVVRRAVEKLKNEAQQGCRR